MGNMYGKSMGSLTRRIASTDYQTVTKTKEEHYIIFKWSDFKIELIPQFEIVYNENDSNK